MKFIHEVYGLLLYLFPRTYREEYGEELQAVFHLSLEDAMKEGSLEAAKIVLRELRGLPKAILYEHLRERRNAKMKRRFDSYFEFTSGSWKEFLTALLPFFLACGVTPLLNYLRRMGTTSGTAGTVLVLVLFGLFLILLFVGVKMGMPRWSLPYLGFLFAILSVYLLSAIFGTPIYLLFQNLRDQSLLFIDILWDGIFWYGLLTGIIVLAIAARVSPTFQRFRSDWTQLCFVLYGAVPFALWMTFDDYVGEEPYMFLAFLVLAAGAWFYVRSNGEWKRFWSLFISLTLTMFIVAIGKAIIIPTQDWPFTIDQGLVVAEVKHTTILWGWFAFGMLIPPGIKFLPWSSVSTQVSSSEG